MIKHSELIESFHVGHKVCNDTVIVLLLFKPVFVLREQKDLLFGKTPREEKKNQQQHTIISLPEINQVGNTVGMVMWYPHSCCCCYSITPSHVRSSLGLIPKIAGGLSLASALCLPRINDASVGRCCFLCCCHGQNVSSHRCFLSRDRVQFDPPDSA